MNSFAAIFLAVVVAALSPTAIAAPDGAEIDVMDWNGMPMRKGCDQNTITINQCAYDVWKKADDEL